MDLPKLQTAYHNAISEITKAYFADYDFVTDPRKLIAAERACFGLLKVECAAKLKVHPDDLATLKMLSDAINLHRETARVIRKGISRQPQDREYHRGGPSTELGQQGEARHTAGQEEYGREAEEQSVPPAVAETSG
jgi:hypothetical protein